MLHSGLRLLAALILIAGPLAAHAAETASLRLGFSKDFGGTAAAPYALSLGVSTTLDDGLKPAAEPRPLPLTGLHFSPGRGLSPLLLGVPWRPAAPTLHAGDDDERPWYGSWGWILAGAVVAVGVVVAADDDDDEDQTNIASNSQEGCTIINPETMSVITGNCP